ncbi:Uncharacterised protein [Mycobacteroides abscessus subsp. abscessus]|nr:Uncharacterised protein [Mycobacteroides abscessus subsp. abscessus]
MAKQKIELYSAEHTYKSLVNFESIQQLNETVRHYRNLLVKSNLKNKRSLMVLLSKLQRYSCKYPGVSYRGKRKIGEDMGLCRKTITRLTKKLCELGFIKEYNSKRIVGKHLQASNIIVIQRCTDLAIVPQEDVVQNLNKVDISKEKQVRQKDLSQPKTDSLSRKHIIKTYVHNEPSYNQLDYKFVSDRVPKEFVEQICGFAYFSTAARIEELYKCVYLSAKKFKISIEEAIPVAIESYRQLIRKMKKGDVGNPFGFFTGILRKKLKTYYVRSLFDEVFDS